MVYVRNFIILLALLVLAGKWYLVRQGLRQPLLKTGFTKNGIYYQYLTSREAFSRAMGSVSLSAKERQWLNKGPFVVFGKSPVYLQDGAYVVMNAEQLKINRMAIKQGFVSRDSKLRKEAGAPGMDAVRHEGEVVAGKWQAYYHLTHLLAFRHCLDDGGLDGTLFTGTAHLNTGARPHYAYSIPQSGSIDSRDARMTYLKDLFRNRQGVIKLENPIVDSHRLFPEGYVARLSLDDLERFYDYMLNYHKGDFIKYAVQLHYAPSAGAIPVAVTVRISNVSKEKQLMVVRLDNTF